MAPRSPGVAPWTELFFRLLQLALFGGGTVGVVIVEAAAEARLRFFAAGDVGDPGYALDNVAKLAKGIAANESSFGLILGDNFYPMGVRDTEDEQWEGTFENTWTAAMKDLGLPLYAVLGNHDWMQNAECQIDYHYKNKGKTSFSMEAHWYTVSVPLRMPGNQDSDASATPRMKLIFIDTQPLLYPDEVGVSQSVREQQMNFVQHALANATEEWIVVIGHHPVYSAGGHGDHPLFVSWLHPMLEHYGVDLYLAGHDHDLEVLQKDNGKDANTGGPLYVVSGSGSRVRECCEDHPHKLWGHGSHGLAVVNVIGDMLKVEMLDMFGGQLFSVSRPRQLKSKGEYVNPVQLSEAWITPRSIVMMLLFLGVGVVALSYACGNQQSKQARDLHSSFSMELTDQS